MAYLKTVGEDGRSDVSFILGKAMLAPQCAPTIPLLELCASVLAVVMAELILDQINFKLDDVKFYCDSKVVFGYIYNESKHFYLFVHNRVQRIRLSTKPVQWLYVPTKHTPANHVSRSVIASCQKETPKSFELVSPEVDVDVRPQVSCLLTQRKVRYFTNLFEPFSTLRGCHS